MKGEVIEVRRGFLGRVIVVVVEIETSLDKGRAMFM